MAARSSGKSGFSSHTGGAQCPNSQLCIFPDATHMIPYDDPAHFNATVERFFREPFVKRDRVKDLFKSYEALIASQQ
jgi:hypothetical protein